MNSASLFLFNVPSVNQFPILGDEKVLEMNSGIHKLKITKMAKFMLYIYFTTKKEYYEQSLCDVA